MSDPDRSSLPFGARRRHPRRPMRQDQPLWRQAVEGIGMVVAMSVAVSLVGLLMAWLAALLL